MSKPIFVDPVLDGAADPVVIRNRESGDWWMFYTNRRANVAIIAGSVLVFAVALFLLRSQVTVGDVSYMRAMIPHHSIAILTSERAQITDPRVRELADGIIEAQRREIAEMEALIADLQGGPPATPELDGR